MFLSKAKVFLLLAFALGASAQNYTITNLTSNGSLPMRGINDSGQVTYYAYDGATGSYRTYFYDGSTSQDIGDLGGIYTLCTAISASGQIIGHAYLTGNAQNHAFSWTQAGGIVDLGTFGGNSSSATGVNASGQVVGGATFVDGVTHAFSWTQAGGLVDLGTLGGDFSWAMAINASGQVVGYSYVAGNTQIHAFSWTQSGGMVDLGTLGGSTSLAYFVNASGQVTGYSSVAGESESHAFSWTQAGGIVDLGTLGGTYSSPTGVTAAGEVVGYSLTPGNTGYRVFSWTPANAMVALATFGGNYEIPLAASATGEIVGYGLIGGAYHAFSMTQAGGIVDLNTRIPTAPAGTELYYALAVSDNGHIGAFGNTGMVLLGPPVDQAAPALGPISANDPVAVNSTVLASAAFTDGNASDTHTALWTWGDATADSVGYVNEANGSGSATQSHAYSAAGVYPLSLTVTDNTGRAATVSRDIVVYDPSAGFVSGGGWILSPPGAYKANQTLAGKATFGFVSRYKKGANVPTGNTEFQFRAANLNFHSEVYDWLVVAGARAQYKGVGTINGAGSFKFLLTAVDGDLLGGGSKDRFRMKIWHYDAATDADVVDYDNQTGAGEGTLAEGTEIGGGSIVIHK